MRKALTGSGPDTATSGECILLADEVDFFPTAALRLLVLALFDPRCLVFLLVGFCVGLVFE